MDLAIKNDFFLFSALTSNLFWSTSELIDIEIKSLNISRMFDNVRRDDEQNYKVLGPLGRRHKQKRSFIVCVAWDNIFILRVYLINELNSCAYASVSAVVGAN